MMKRKLLLFATFVAAVLPSNAAFYLSGTYNNGSSSNNNLDGCLFVDEDGDGIFTYTLNLDNGYLEKFSVWDSDQGKRIGHDYGIRSGEINFLIIDFAVKCFRTSPFLGTWPHVHIV